MKQLLGKLIHPLKNSYCSCSYYTNGRCNKRLSTDQFYGYKIVSVIRSGIISKDLALLEIGPVNHSRGLTTANRLSRIWISKHELEGF